MSDKSPDSYKRAALATAAAVFFALQTVTGLILPDGMDVVCGGVGIAVVIAWLRQHGE